MAGGGWPGCAKKSRGFLKGSERPDASANSAYPFSAFKTQICGGLFKVLDSTVAASWQGMEGTAGL